MINKNFYDKLKENKAQNLYNRLSGVYNFGLLKEATVPSKTKEEIMAALGNLFSEKNVFKQEIINTFSDKADFIKVIDQLAQPLGLDANTVKKLKNSKNFTVALESMETELNNIAKTSKLSRADRLAKVNEAKGKFAEAIKTEIAGASPKAKPVTKLDEPPAPVDKSPKTKLDEPAEANLSPEIPKQKPPVSPEVAAKNVKKESKQIDQQVEQKTGVKNLTEPLSDIEVAPVLEKAAKQKSEPGFFQSILSDVKTKISSEEERKKISNDIVGILKGKAPFTLTKRANLDGFIKQILIFIAFYKIRSYLMDSGTVIVDKDSGEKVFITKNSKGDEMRIPAGWTLSALQYAINPIGAIGYGFKDELVIPIFDSILSVIGKKDPQAVAIVKNAKEAEQARPANQVGLPTTGTDTTTSPPNSEEPAVKKPRNPIKF